MKQLNHRFEHWYKLTHWMAPELTKRSDDSYENEAVQAMYIAYRAGFNRANKERKEMYSADVAILRQALEALEDADRIMGHDDEETQWRGKHWSAITALRAAVGRNEMSTQPEAHPEFPPHDDKVHAGAVYWYVGKDGKYYSSNEVKLFMHSKSKSLFFEPPEWMQKHHNLIPLYTDPPTDDTALLQQALEALLMMRDQYGEEACPECDHADAAVHALRERLGETK